MCIINYLRNRFFAHFVLLAALLLSLLGQTKAAPLPTGFDVEFSFGTVTGLNGSFDSPSIYNYSFDGASGLASGSTGIFDDTGDILSIDISGNYSGDSQNAFIAPLTLTFTNLDSLSIVDIGLNVSFLASASHSGFGLSSVALIYDGGLIPLDSVEADDPFFGFTGEVTNQLLDISSIPSFSVGTAPVVAELALVFEQFHTGPFFGPEFSDYSVHAEIGIGSIEVFQVSAPSVFFLMILGLSLLGWQQSSRIS